MGIEEEIKIICNGEFEIIRITEEIYDEVLQFYKDNFLKYETVSVACEILKSKLSVEESFVVVKIALQDHLSFAVRHCETKEIVAVRINRIWHPATEKKNFYPQFRSSGALCDQEFLHRMKSTFDLFKEWNIDCAFELSFTTTHPDFCGLGLATKLTEFSIELAHQLSKGIFSDKETLPARIRKLRPKAICSIYTSLYTQKLGKKLGMKTLGKIPFTQFFYKGKSFAEKIDPIHEYATFVAMKL